MKLTDRIVAGLVRPADKDDVVYWDDTLPCFGVRLRGDHKAYLIQFRVGPLQRRESLGDTRQTKLEDARRAARQRFALAQLGVDPAAERAKARAKAAAARQTLGSVAQRYLDFKRDRLRPTTFRAASMYLLGEHWRPLHNYSLESVRRADVAAVLLELTKSRGPITASRARANLAALFGWAHREGLYDGPNPVAATNDPAAGRPHRGRVLSLDELVVIWRNCRGDNFGNIVKLLMLLGCRRAEIGDLKWSEVDLERGTVTFSGSRTKNRRDLTLALPPVALSILRSVPRHDGRDSVFGDGGFTSWSSQTRALKERIRNAQGKPLVAWTLHDARRSFATHAAEIGIQPHIIEAVLNHVSGHKGGIAGIYNKAGYRAEIAMALQRWSETLMASVEGRKSKVSKLVPLRA